MVGYELYKKEKGSQESTEVLEKGKRKQRRIPEEKKGIQKRVRRTKKGITRKHRERDKAIKGSKSNMGIYKQGKKEKNRNQQ